MKQEKGKEIKRRKVEKQHLLCPSPLRALQGVRDSQTAN